MNAAAALPAALVDAAGQPSPTVADVRCDATQPFVGESREVLSDAERETQIVAAGQLLERRYAVYEETGCFAALGDAHRAESVMRKLIAGRSPEQVARMESARGLT